MIIPTFTFFFSILQSGLPSASAIVQPCYGSHNEFKLRIESSTTPKIVLKGRTPNEDHVEIALRSYSGPNQDDLIICVEKDPLWAKSFKSKASGGIINYQSWSGNALGDKVVTGEYKSPGTQVYSYSLDVLYGDIVVTAYLHRNFPSARQTKQAELDHEFLEGVVHGILARMHPFVCGESEYSLKSRYLMFEKLLLPNGITAEVDDLKGVITFKSASGSVVVPIGAPRASYKEDPSNPTITAYIGQDGKLYFSKDMLESVKAQLGR